MLPEADQRIATEANDKKPTSPLPSYELALQQRRGITVEDRTMQKSPVHNVYTRIEESSISPSIPSDFFHHYSDSTHSDSSSSYQPSSTLSDASFAKGSKIENTAAPRALPRKFEGKLNSTANSSLLSTAGVSYFPNGRVSPTKSPSAFSLKGGQVQATK